MGGTAWVAWTFNEELAFEGGELIGSECQDFRLENGVSAIQGDPERIGSGFLDGVGM